MTKVLAYTSPARGHRFPIVPILQELRSRGHDVAVRTLEEYVGELSALGLHAKPLAPNVAAIAHEDWKAGAERIAAAFAAAGGAIAGADAVEELVTKTHSS